MLSDIPLTFRFFEPEVCRIRISIITITDTLFDISVLECLQLL